MDIVRCDSIKKYFPITRGHLKAKVGVVKALDGVSLTIEKGQTFGIVGESGCGKTTLGKIILGVLKQDSGEVELDTDRSQAVFQDPYNSLDPKMKVFDIVSEGLVLQRDAKDAKNRVREILELVRLPNDSVNKYPHQFSGGERQRIAIARALITGPELIVCDEPVSSLDVTIQLDILRLLKDVKKRFGVTYLFISHDLRVIKFMCDRIAVMKDGKIVEEGESREICQNAKHPYTELLLSSIPDI